MTGLMISGIVALVAIFATLVLIAYSRRRVGGDDDTIDTGHWYKVRKPVKQSVVTDAHGDFVHQDGSTTASFRERTQGQASAGGPTSAHDQTGVY